MSLYKHVPHPRIEARRGQPQMATADHLPRGNAVARFNTRLAVLITRAVGSMWCAYIFAAFDCISLPDAIQLGTSAIVAWIAQTFLQLVLLSIIMVGQNVQAAASDQRAVDTYNDAEAILAELATIHEHLNAQDNVLEAKQGSGDGA